jgi:hypothetical protein
MKLINIFILDQLCNVKCANHKFFVSDHFIFTSLLFILRHWLLLLAMITAGEPERWCAVGFVCHRVWRIGTKFGELGLSTSLLSCCVDHLLWRIGRRPCLIDCSAAALSREQPIGCCSCFRRCADCIEARSEQRCMREDDCIEKRSTEVIWKHRVNVQLSMK